MGCGMKSIYDPRFSLACSQHSKMTQNHPHEDAKTYKLLRPVGFIVVLCFAWEIIVVYLQIPAFLLPTPSMIMLEIWENLSFLQPHFFTTFYEVIIGFITAVLIGIFVAILLAYSEFLRSTLLPVLVFLQTTPKVAIAPLFVVWFGFGLLPKVVIAFLVCFFPITINMSVGLTLVEQDVLRLVRSYKATPWQTFRKIRFPNSLPYLFAGMKIAVPLAVVGAIVGEFVGADRGLGYVILLANADLKTELLFAAIFCLAIMGMLLFGAVALLERLLVPWSLSEEIEIHSGMA